GLSEQAVAILEGGPRGPELAWAYRVMAHLKMLDRETDAALEWGAKAVAFAEYLGDAAQLSAAHNAVGSAALMGGREGAAEHFARSIELGRRHDIPERVAAAYSNLGSGCGELHRFAEASVNLERAIATAEEHDLDFVRLYSLSWLALVRMYQGAWDEATEIAQQVLN